jgi:hypothetical protein
MRPSRSGSIFNNTLGPKRLQILRELAPDAHVIAMLVNPSNPNTESCRLVIAQEVG